MVLIFGLPFLFRTDNADQFIKRSELAEKISKLKSELDAQVARNSELIKTVNKLENMKKDDEKGENDLSKLVEMSIGKADIGIKRKTVDFECELDGVDAFLKSREIRRSEFFFARHLAWKLHFRSSIVSGEEFLSVFLYAKNYADASQNWSVKATYDVSIVNQSGGQKCSNSSTQDFATKGFLGWGLSEFISIEDLRTGGYIKNDKIIVRVHLEVGEVVRIE